MRRVMEEALVRAKLLGAEGELGKEMMLKASSIYGLRDTPLAGIQDEHVDWSPRQTAKYRHHDPLHMPLSTMWACSEPFLLAVGKYGGHDGMLLTVKRGQMIVFRGDLPHGGGGHVTRTFRVHGFLARKGERRADFLYAPAVGV